MAKLNKLKKYIPTAERLKKNRSIHWVLSWFKSRPYLWRFEKHSVSCSVAISFFIAFLPLPFEMLMVTLLAIVLHANLPIAILSTWISNPFTLVPANYFSYKVGVWILKENGEYTAPLKLKFHWTSWTLLPGDIAAFIGSLSKAYLIGLPIVSISTALSSYALVYVIWSIVELFTLKKKS